MANGSVRVRVLRYNGSELEVLLVRERFQPKKRKANGEEFDKPGYWGLPGGRVREDESLYEAAIRELAEETGLEADIRREATDSVLGYDNHHVIHFFEGFWPYGEIKITEPDIECADWVNVKEAALGVVRGTPVYQKHLQLISREPFLIENPDA